MTITMSKSTYTVDAEQGFDVYRGKTAVAHVASYEEARRLCAGKSGYWIQYQLVREG